LHHSTNKLAALIGSRICHDLISPIGAITNGLELMQMSGTALTPEMALITESVENANARIRFFRVAYGLASPNQIMGRTEIVSILKAVAHGARVSFHWGPLEDMPRQEVRLVFLALQCLETAMPYGGRITISHEDGLWAIAGTADKLRQTGPLWAALENPGQSDDINPAEVQFALFPPLLAETGRKLSLRITEQDILIRF
jgi:histidine phosphotransferase ChpT